MHLLENLLDRSRWSPILSILGISTGKANAMFIASFNMGLSCYMHDITVCALYIYQNEKLMKYIWSNPKTKIIFENKCRKNPVRNTQCLNSWIWYWSQSFSYLSFQSCCDLGASSVTSKQITPWMFSLKHYIYVRWLPVNLTQMIILKEIHPSLYEKLKTGNLSS